MPHPVKKKKEIIYEDDSRYRSKNNVRRNSSSFRVNPKAKLNTSQIEDRRHWDKLQITSPTAQPSNKHETDRVSEANRNAAIKRRLKKR